MKDKISGSMIGAIMGLSEWVSPADAWLIAKGLKTVETNEQMEAGLFLEPFILDWYEKKTGEKLERQVYLEDGAFCGTLDGLGRFVVEIKTTKRRLDTLPEEWLAQVQWYLMLSKLERGIVVLSELPDLSLELMRKVVYHIPIDELTKLRVFSITRDDAWLETAKARALEFLNLLKMDEPPVEWAIPERAYKRLMVDEAIESNEEIDAIYNELKHVIEQKKELEAKEESLKEKIKDFIGVKSILIRNGTVLATYNERETKTIDSKRLLLELPDVYQKYVTVKKTRFLLIK